MKKENVMTREGALIGKLSPLQAQAIIKLHHMVQGKHWGSAIGW